MNLVVRLLAITVAVVLTAAAIGVLLMPAPAGAAGTAPVTVMNTPLPVQLQGTGSIAGTVQAAQSGQWSVDVGSLPAVQLAAGTTVGTSDLESSVRQAYAVDLCNDNCGAGAAATLPVGNRFVIENVSGKCYITVSTQALANAIVFASLNGQMHSYQLVGQQQGALERVFNNQVRIYADGGVPNGLSIGGDGNEVCRATLSGRLIQMDTFPSP